METEDIILGKAKYEDWSSIYRNVWSRPETAEYVGRGYGKQILRLLMGYCYSLGGQEFYYSTRAGNLASRALALSCGLTYQHSEQKTDQRSVKTYELEIYKRNLKSTGGGI